jgi:predicted O-methyltransferase YrrM
VDDLRYVSFPAALSEITQETRAVQFSMASEPLVGTLLRTLAASKPGGRFLELGTGTGVGTAWLLDGMDQTSTLVSLDNDEAVQQVAAKALGNDERLTLLPSGALAFLLEQPAETFDLVFADAMPGKYEGPDEALRVVKVGGFYIVDDLLPQPNWPMGMQPKFPFSWISLPQIAGSRFFHWSGPAVLSWRFEGSLSRKPLPTVKSWFHAVRTTTESKSQTSCVSR